MKPYIIVDIKWFKKLALSIILLSVLIEVNQAFAQTSDIFKFYILYDKSGSVPIIDSNNNNLARMLDSLIQINSKNEIESKVVFDIIFFGKETNSPEGVRYGFDDLWGNKNRTKKLVKDIKDNIGSSTTNQYTHIHTALKSIRDSLISENPIKTHSAKDTISSGIFIFTDGILRKGDFKPDSINFPTREAYIDTVMTLIVHLNDILRKPVYLIQSSPAKINDYYPLNILSNQNKNFSNTKYALGDKYFWINSSISFENDSLKSIRSDYKSFINKAIYDILIQGNLNENKRDTIATALRYQEIVNLLKTFKKDTSTVSKNNWNILSTSSVVDSLKTLDSLLQQDKLSKNGIERIVLILDFLTKNPEKLYSVVSELHTKYLLNKSPERKQIRDNFRGIYLQEANFAAPLTDVDRIKTQNKLNTFKQNLAEGLAEYVVERAEQEAIYAFFENVNEILFNKYPHIGQYLFPYLRRATSESANFVDLKIIREAFYRDLKSIPENIIQHPYYSRSEGLIALAYFHLFYEALIKQGSLEFAAGELINHRISIPDYWNNSNAKRVEEAIYFTSNLIKFLSEHDLNKLYENVHGNELKELSILLGSVAIGNKFEYDSIIVEKIVPLIGKTYNNYRLIKGQINELHELLKPTNATSDYDGLKKYRQEVITDILWRSADLLLSGFEIIDAIRVQQSTTINLKSSSDLIKASHDCLEAYFFIREDNYAQAVLLMMPHILRAIKPQYNQVLNKNEINKRNVKKKQSLYPKNERFAFDLYLVDQFKSKIDSLYLINSISKEDLDDLTKKIKGISKDKYIVYLNNFFTQKPAIDSILYALGDIVEVNDYLTKLISVAGEVSTISTSEEAKNVIAKYTLPVASYKIKRNTHNTLMLNAYAGIGSFYYFHGTSRLRPGIFAPIGFEYSLSNKKRLGTWSLFASIIDVGNIIDYRLLGNDKESDNVINFEKIVSPGFFIIKSMHRKLPLSTGIGYQVNPNKVSVFIAFDLPLFSIWRRY